jgi:hypothetical protein
MPSKPANRDTAAKLIQLASEVMDPDIKGQLIDMAILFERLADYVDDRGPTLAPGTADQEPK